MLFKKSRYFVFVLFGKKANYHWGFTLRYISYIIFLKWLASWPFFFDYLINKGHATIGLIQSDCLSAPWHLIKENWWVRPMFIDLTSTCGASSTLFTNSANKNEAQGFNLGREVVRSGAYRGFKHMRLTIMVSSCLCELNAQQLHKPFQKNPQNHESCMSHLMILMLIV